MFVSSLFVRLFAKFASREQTSSYCKQFPANLPPDWKKLEVRWEALISRWSTKQKRNDGFCCALVEGSKQRTTAFTTNPADAADQQTQVEAALQIQDLSIGPAAASNLYLRVFCLSSSHEICPGSSRGQLLHVAVLITSLLICGMPPFPLLVSSMAVQTTRQRGRAARGDGFILKSSKAELKRNAKPKFTCLTRLSLAKCREDVVDTGVTWTEAQSALRVERLLCRCLVGAYGGPDRTQRLRVPHQIVLPHSCFVVFSHSPVCPRFLCLSKLRRQN